MDAPRHVDDTVASYATRAARAIRTRELGAVFTPAKVRYALARGDLTAVAPGIVASSVHANAFAVRAEAATLWADAPISETAALFAWGLLPKPPPIVTVTTLASRNPRKRPGVDVRRTLRRPDETCAGGIRVVTPPEAIAAGFGRVAPYFRAEVVFRAVRDQLATPHQIRRTMAALPRVPARYDLERRLAAAEAGAHSYLEEVGLRKVFAGREFASFTRQHELVIEGDAFRLDMFCRDARLAIELDGQRFHANSLAWQRALTRDAILAGIGIRTIRFSYRDLHERPEWCRDVVRRALRVQARIAI